MSCGLFFRHHADVFAGLIEQDHAVGEGEQGMVAAAADVAAGQELGAALTHDDPTRANPLAGIYLHAQPLRIGIATVAAGALTLLMCHDFTSQRISPRPSRGLSL